ncbi:MAG: SWIM zinc finger family protein [Chloroflexi bacterium]|nr:SWIM zinc finger family protein [Chloroflexota bacterium]MBV9598330.1 SWIM zinc finger family protein [Chloroflexota bacterium]
MAVTITDREPRSIKAVEIAADAGQWLKCHLADERKAYGIPSQRTPGQYHVADSQTCSCPDFQRRGLPCKHVLAVRLHCALVRAEQAQQPQRRGHLRLVVA